MESIEARTKELVEGMLRLVPDKYKKYVEIFQTSYIPVIRRVCRQALLDAYRQGASDESVRCEFLLKEHLQKEYWSENLERLVEIIKEDQK